MLWKCYPKQLDWCLVGNFFFLSSFHPLLWPTTPILSPTKKKKSPPTPKKKRCLHSGWRREKEKKGKRVNRNQGPQMNEEAKYKGLLWLANSNRLLQRRGGGRGWEYCFFFQHLLLPNQQCTLNKLPTELRCRNYANKRRLSLQIRAKGAKTCMHCVDRIN